MGQRGAPETTGLEGSNHCHGVLAPPSIDWHSLRATISAIILPPCWGGGSPGTSGSTRGESTELRCHLG